MLGEHEKGNVLEFFQNDQKYSNSTENLSSLTSLTNAYFRCITQEFLFLFFALTGAQLSKYYNLRCTSCNTNPFANFSHCGVWGSTSCGVECAWLGALPHLAPPTHVYVALLPGTGVGLGPCELLPGPQRMWSGKWDHVECVCFDVDRLRSLQRTGFWCCLYMPLDNRFTIFPTVSHPSARLEEKKLYCSFFTRAALYILWHVMMCFWERTVWKSIRYDQQFPRWASRSPLYKNDIRSFWFLHAFFLLFHSVCIKYPRWTHYAPVVWVWIISICRRQMFPNLFWKQFPLS